MSMSFLIGFRVSYFDLWSTRFVRECTAGKLMSSVDYRTMTACFKEDTKLP